MEISSTGGSGSLWLFNSFFQLAQDFEGRSDESKLLRFVNGVHT